MTIVHSFSSVKFLVLIFSLYMANRETDKSLLLSAILKSKYEMVVMRLFSSD